MRSQDIDLRALRERLGLRDDATPAEVLETYRALERFLAADRVPERLRTWAARQLDPGREVYDRSATAPGSTEPGETAPAGEDLPEFFDEDAATPELHTGRRSGRAGRRGAGAPGPRSRRASGPAVGWRGLVLVLGIALLAGGLLIGNPGLFGGLAQSGQPASSAASQASAQPAPIALNEARVAELKATLANDPTNADALFELGEMNFQAERWQDSIDWFTKLLEVAPDNLDARIEIGSANFNMGRDDEAKQAWEDVAKRDPSNAEVHYYLGFLYANSPTPDMDRAFQEWDLVVKLAPNSDLAKTVQTHLDALRK